MYLDDYVKASLENDSAGESPPETGDAIEEMKAEMAIELNKIHADLEKRFKELEKRFDSEYEADTKNNEPVDAKEDGVNEQNTESKGGINNE